MSGLRDYAWLNLAETGAAEFQQCSRKGFYAIIVDKRGMQIGSGWNGVPSGMRHCDAGGCPRGSSQPVCTSGAESLLGTRMASYDDCWAIHAEANALLHSDWTARRGGTMYCSGAPCFGCAKLIAGSGLKRLVCGDAPNDETWDDVLEFLDDAGIIVEVLL